jgi:hypothetical protein
MIYFLNLLTDEQLFAIFETIVHAVLNTHDSTVTTAHRDALNNEEHQIVTVLSNRGHSEKLVALHKSICDDVFAAWQKAKVAQPVG